MLTGVFIHIPTLVLVLLANRVSTWEVGPHYNVLDLDDTAMAMDCLEENYCSRFLIPFRSNIRCRVNDAIVYVCNYAAPLGKKTGMNPCSRDEMETAARLVREEGQGHTRGWFQKYMNGWWFERAWNKAYGFELPCPDGSRECEALCGNNWNVPKNKNWFDFDVECFPTPQGLRNCTLYSITSEWESKGTVLWPWIDGRT